MEKEGVGISGFVTFELTKADGSVTVMKKENKQKKIKITEDVK